MGTPSVVINPLFRGGNTPSTGASDASSVARTPATAAAYTPASVCPRAIMEPVQDPMYHVPKLGATPMLSANAARGLFSTAIEEAHEERTVPSATHEASPQVPQAASHAPDVGTGALAPNGVPSADVDGVSCFEAGAAARQHGIRKEAPAAEDAAPDQAPAAPEEKFAPSAQFSPELRVGQPLSALTIRHSAKTGAQQQPAACASQKPNSTSDGGRRATPAAATNAGQLLQGAVPEPAAESYEQHGAGEDAEDDVAEQLDEQRGSPVQAPLQRRALPPRTPLSAMRARTRLPGPPNASTPIGSAVRVTTPGRCLFWPQLLVCCAVLLCNARWSCEAHPDQRDVAQ